MTHTCKDSGITFPTKDDWILFHEEHPPYDKPILTTNGKYYEIRIFRVRNNLKYWESLSLGEIPNFQVDYWRFLPELPKENE
jgi:hypothetical protein